jgi:hypothetical protein
MIAALISRLLPPRARIRGSISAFDLPGRLFLIGGHHPYFRTSRLVAWRTREKRGHGKRAAPHHTGLAGAQ